MPVPNIRAARVAIYTAFKTAWDAGGGGVQVMYDDIKADPPDGDVPFVRVRATHVSAPQVTVGGPNGKRFRHSGFVTVQILTPYDDGRVQNDALGQIAKSAFQGVETAPDAVTFRNARLNEGPRDGAWTTSNIIADFEWDEVI